MTETSAPIKRTRTRKTACPAAPAPGEVLSPALDFPRILEGFVSLLEKINKAREDFEALEKEMTLKKEAWVKEQKRHDQEVLEKKQEEEFQRRKEKETYEYEITRSHKMAEDEFLERKAKWEKELLERREEIEKDKKELLALRSQVESFEDEKDGVVKEACAGLTKDLTGKFETERKLREQELRAEKEILTLKIEALTAENERQAKEMENLKRALEEATRQVKEIAVKVIEAGGNKSSSQEASSPFRGYRSDKL